MTQDTPPTPFCDEADRLLQVLSDRYAVALTRLTRLGIGQGTVNYRATCEDRDDLFVKCYPDGVDLFAEGTALQLAGRAASWAVPVPGVLRNRADEEVDTVARVSLWEWVPGAVVTEGLTSSQAQQVGSTLGLIHRCFAALPASAGPSPQVTRWHDRMDPAHLVARVDRLRTVVSERIASGAGDDFDLVAARTLDERRADLHHLPGLLADLPDLSTQVLHGDYTLVNLLFDGDRLSGVVDFRPPEAFLTAYELGRIVFSPDTIATDTGWLTRSRDILLGYLAARPETSAIDVRACGQVALIQLLRSLYGVKEHYLHPGLFQQDLDRFWIRRHHSVRTLLAHLPEVDAMLTEMTTTHRPGS